MLESLKLIIELHGIDSIILAEKKIVDSMPSKLVEVENAFKTIQSDFEKKRQKLSELEKKKKEKEREVEDTNEKISKTKAHASEIKKNEEYKAHLKEIEAVEKKRYTLEDEILSIMETMELESKNLVIEEQKIKQEKEKTEALKKEIEKEIADAQKALDEFKAKRDELAKTIDSDDYKDYMTISQACFGIAVAEAKDEMCGGCNMNIPPQMYVQMKNNETIEHCPQCRRILYRTEKSE
jgi:predicted  nucleic acid-binding Zn-ribbon protein